MNRGWAIAALLFAAGCDGNVMPPPAATGLVLLPGGEFTMGHASGRPGERPRAVRVSSFHIDRHPVTQELFEKVMGRNPSKHRGSLNPVEQCRWTDAARFCNRASEQDGLLPCYDEKTWVCDFEADGYRLPTEAEWEYACRAGAATKYSFGDDAGELPKHAWFKRNAEGRTHPIGEKPPNAWGLFDMHGNVWQWCNDWYAEEGGTASDPRGPSTGRERVLRGGAWESPAERCTAFYRYKEAPSFADACLGADSYGFRRVRRVGGKPKVSPVTERPVDPKPVAPVNVAPPAAPGSRLDPGTLKGTIVFVSNRAGALDIWRMHASGRDPRPLTRDEHPDASPRFSPDGTRLFYTSERKGIPEVWSMSRDGTGAKRITEGSQGDVSPDGKSIVFIRDHQAWVRELGSGAERRLTPERWERVWGPAWSPDGRRIALSSRHTGEIGVYLLNPDGTGVVALKTGEQACTPRWSPDGARILCQTTRGHLREVKSDGSQADDLTFGTLVEHDGRYIAGGSLVLFSKGQTEKGPWQLWAMRLEDEASAPLTTEGSNSLADWHLAEN